jgi:hypothetical protein
MSNLFRESLLGANLPMLVGTARVSWRVERMVAHHRWTMIGDSPFDLCRQDRALLAYPPILPGDPYRRERERFIRHLTHRLARRIREEERPPELRNPPRDRELDATVRKGNQLCAHAIEAAWMVMMASHERRDDPDWERLGSTYAALRLAEKVKEFKTGIGGESGEPAYMLRRLRRSLRALHLALPLLWPNDFERARPELPWTFDEADEDPRWVLPALDAAAVWREVLPRMGLGIAEGELIEVWHFNTAMLGSSGHR